MKDKKKLLQYAFHAAVLAGVIVAGMKYINGEEFTRALHGFNWVYAPLILLLSIAYLFTKAWRFAGQLRELTSHNRWLLMKGYVSAQACTLLPGGIAFRAGIMDQIGVKIEDSAASVVLSSFSDQIVLIFCALLSALWFESARRPVFILLGILIVVSILLGLEATRTWLVGVVERLMGRLKLLDRWRGFLESAKDVATVPILLAGVGNAAFAFALMVLALDLAVRGVDAEIPYATLLLAFTLPSLLGRISAMPGGIGVTEAGMVGILDAAPGVTLNQAAAAVLIFRLGTVLFSAIFGGTFYFLGWRRTPEVATS